MPDIAFVCYEQPLSERYRTFLRLENLFLQMDYHLAEPQAWSRRSALNALLDLLNVLSRQDLRGELTKELSSQRASFSRLEGHEDIDPARLQPLLDEIDQTQEQLKLTPSRFADGLLRGNEMLASLNNRSAIHGGSFGFDVPSAQFWLSRADEVQQHDIANWMEPVEGIRNTVFLLLSMLRESTRPTAAQAQAGMFMQKTDAGTQLIRVFVPQDLPIYPEISSGKHRSTVRFMEQIGNNLQADQSPLDIDFMLACCKL